MGRPKFRRGKRIHTQCYTYTIIDWERPDGDTVWYRLDGNPYGHFARDGNWFPEDQIEEMVATSKKIERFMREEDREIRRTG